MVRSRATTAKSSSSVSTRPALRSAQATTAASAKPSGRSAYRCVSCADARKVLGERVVERVRARLEILQQRVERMTAEASLCEVAELGEDADGDDERPAVALEGAADRQMVTVASVEQRIERRRVERDQRSSQDWRSHASESRAESSPLSATPIDSGSGRCRERRKRSRAVRRSSAWG